MDKEVENSQKLINILQYQIEQLKEKYRLIVQQHEDVEVNKRIVSIKGEIEELKQANLEEKNRMNREGKEIEKFFMDGRHVKMNTLETDHQLVMNRLDKLKADSTRVQDDTVRLETKAQELEPFIYDLEGQCQKIKNKQLDLAEEKTKQHKCRQKKSQLEAIKKRIEFHKGTSQVKYYKLLKELESETTMGNMIETKTTQVETRTKFAKQQIASLESILTEAKRKKK